MTTMSDRFRPAPRLTRADVREIVRQELATRAALAEPVPEPSTPGLLRIAFDAFDAASFVANAGAAFAIEFVRRSIR